MLLSIVISITLALVFAVVLVFAIGPNADLNQSRPAKSSSAVTPASEGAVELRRAVDASIALLGSTGWVQVNEITGKRVFFNPAYEGQYQVAAKDDEASKPYVMGSMFEVVPFELMDILTRTASEITVTKKGDVFIVANRDNVAKGTAVTEYATRNGVIVSKTIRDHIGKKNELNVVVTCNYGLDPQAKSDLIYANTHQQNGGHD
jgi:hypothetical protein